MWIALGLLLPTALFVVACAVDLRFQRIAAAVAALWVFIAMASLIAGRNQWPRTTQIAWTGVARVAGTAAPGLTIGGSEQDAVTGWPNGSFAPMIQVQPNGPSAVRMTISRGGGFVSSSTGELLNGMLVPEGRSWTTDGYTFELLPKYWPLSFWPFPYELRVRRGDNAVVTDVTLTRHFSGYSYISLDYLNTRTSKETVRDAVYQNWARPILLAVSRKDIRILDRATAFRADCAAPCTVAVKWRHGRLLTTFSVDANQTVHAHFQRPWRRVSPVPDAVNGRRQLVVTREAQPGDYAFILPLGGGHADMRALLRIDEEQGLARFAGASPPDAQRNDADGGVVTSATSVRSGDYRFDFATSVDVLHPGVVVFRLIIALALLVAGVMFFGAAGRPDQWLASGIAVVFFALLSFRVALAVRYAALPEFLDDIAIKGVVLSLVAVTALPALLLLEARLREDVARPSAARGAGDRGLFRSFCYLAAIIVATLFQLTVAGSVWPSVPRALVPGWRFNAAVCLALAAVGMHVVLLTWRAYRSHLRARFSYERFAEATSAFWRSVADARRHLKWYAVVALFAVAALAGIAMVRFIPGQRLVQEIASPLLLTLLPALLWLAAGVYLPPPKGTARFAWMPSPSLLFWAGLTVFLPAVLIPAAIGDPGSILATASVFLPVAIVLLLSDRARKAGVAVAAALLLAALAATVLYLNSGSTTKLPGTGNVQTRLLVFRRDAGIQKNILLESEGLEDAAQHTWQNKAIAHEGSWLGRGYGNAPTRRSQVSQDTLQFDSVFSFFVFSEHGLAGAGALILIYALPLLLFVFSRRETTLSGSLGAVIAAALFGEAWFHAAMNIGAWPFAGRNLPLLSVNSGTDVLKWLLLFLVAVATPFWRTTVQRTSPRDAAPPVISAPRYGLYATVFTAFAALCAGIIIYKGVRNVNDDRLGEPFTWDSILATVQRFAADGTLALDKNNNIVPRNGVALDDSLLTRQIEAFNQLPIEEKTGEPPHPQLPGRIFSANTADEYARAIRDEVSQHGDDPRPRPPLFRLTPLPVYADEEGFVPVVGPRYAIRANPEFNMRVSFRELQTRESLPSIVASDQQAGTYTLQGSAFSIVIPRRFHDPYESRAVLLSPSSGSDVSVASDSNPALSRGEVTLRVKGRRGWMLHPFVRFDVTPEGLLFLDDVPRGFRLRLRRAEHDTTVLPGHRIQLLAGDRVDLAYEIGVDAGFVVGENGPAPVVGPAWVMGRWLPAYDRRSAIPWTPYLARALEHEWERLGPAAATERYRALTFDLGLQQAAQETVAQHGHALHDAKLALLSRQRSANGRGVSQALLKAITEKSQPPRVALTAITIPDGEVIAMAGWPRMNPGRVAGRCTGADSWCPPSVWVDEAAPSFIRTRYGGDRNFDRIEMGSSTKPLLAAAALKVHPQLDAELHVTGPAGVENEVFGIPIPGRTGWKILHGGSGWVDFTHFLAISDNRYEVRLGFLALAEKPGADVRADSGSSPSALESMDGHTAWHRYPQFPPVMQFSWRKPDTLQRIDDSPFAQEIRAMYGVGVKEGEMRPRRGSFWSGDFHDDQIQPISPDAPAAPAAITETHPFDVISPEIADLGFDFVSSPRAYVSLLLGGNENRWANVDFAGAFATAVTGQPTIPHVLKLKTLPEVPPDRRRFADVAAHLRPGLQEVVRSGTAKFAQHLLIPPAIQGIADVRVYAKTGTLAVGEGASTTSRLVIAYIRWADEAKGIVKKGVVLSFVAQDAHQGDATQWLGEYVAANQERIAAYLR
ncbi:MAG TPA: hypothetical protein VGJ82_23240 [Thermoanaerobaculia bacterium]